MSRRTGFRLYLPIVQTVLAALFWGIGLWQRNQVLSQHSWGDQTLRETTARFHVWPWPYKFAAIANMPAFLAGALVPMPSKTLRPELAEAIELAASLLFVAVLWHWVGYRLDRRWHRANSTSGLATAKAPWILLFAFTAVCFLGAILPMGYVGFIPYGVVVWIATAVTALRMTSTSLAPSP